MTTRSDDGLVPPSSREGALHLHERQLAGILDTVMDAIITVDARQRILIFNHAASTMFGRSAADMLGQPLDPLIPLSGRAAHSHLIAGYARFGTTARAMGKTRVLMGLRADGTQFPIEASISQVGEGDDTLMTVAVRDATPLRGAEQARSASANAEATHRAKAEFLSRVSHELHTPLNAVLGLTRLLKASTHGKLTPAESEQLTLVLAAGERLNALIDDMLDAGGGSPAQDAAPASPPGTDDCSGTVLYVEDDPVNVILVQELLKPWPRVQLEIATDGRAGMSMAKALHPDLILLDMHLPDFHGLQVLRMLRNEDATRHIRVVLLSAGGTPDEVAASLAAGAAHYWTKPINFSQFLAGLRTLLTPQAKDR